MIATMVQQPFPPTSPQFMPQFSGIRSPPPFQILEACATGLSAISKLNIRSEQTARTYYPISSKPITLSHLFYNDNIQTSDQIFYIPNSEYDPLYNCDFTFYPPFGWEWCTRGPYPYKRPAGWNRKALRVIRKYEDDVWLGQQGWRDYSTPGEWMVSYHGTKKQNVPNIVAGGYDTNMSVRQRYGPGIYSTPDPMVAERYAQEFLYNGEWYKCILQNRVNPQGTLPFVSHLGDGIYFTNPNQNHIRPYGICLKKI